MDFASAVGAIVYKQTRANPLINQSEIDKLLGLAH